jgi:hypothetical protein
MIVMVTSITSFGNRLGVASLTGVDNPIRPKRKPMRESEDIFFLLLRSHAFQ